MHPVAALAGLRETVAYEGQAAIELEQTADESEQGSYQFALLRENDRWVSDWRPVVRALAEDVEHGLSVGRISMRFHRALAALLADAAEQARRESGCNSVALSGGCFQNELLLRLGTEALKRRGFLVCTNHLVPCNDGGISYGQTAAAAVQLRERSTLCALQSPEQ